jgi:hypothetical protein
VVLSRETEPGFCDEPTRVEMLAFEVYAPTSYVDSCVV